MTTDMHSAPTCSQLDVVPGCMGMYVRSDQVPSGVPQLSGEMPYIFGDELRQTLKVGLCARAAACRASAWPDAKGLNGQRPQDDH